MRDRLGFHHGDLSGRLLNTWKQAGQSKRRGIIIQPFAIRRENFCRWRFDDLYFRDALANGRIVLGLQQFAQIRLITLASPCCIFQKKTSGAIAYDAPAKCKR